MEIKDNLYRKGIEMTEKEANGDDEEEEKNWWAKLNKPGQQYFWFVSCCETNSPVAFFPFFAYKNKKIANSPLLMLLR